MVPFGVERVSACWPRKPMRVMRFLQSMFLSSFRAPIRWGDRCEGGRSQSNRDSFSEGPGQIVCAVQKAQPAICRGDRNPPGLELASEAAERGNYPEARPNEERLKGRRA